MEKAIDLEEPATHTHSWSWREYILCQDYSLIRDQLRSYYELKQEASILFRSESPRWDLIKSVYQQYFQQEGKTSGKQFMQLGFQGQHPQTDLRAGGILSLQLILRFIRKHRSLVQQMSQDKGNFFFAITAINIYFFLKKYFHLSNDLMPGRDVEEYAPRRAFKNFCQLQSKNSQFLFMVHQYLLKYFYERVWKQEQGRNPQKQTLLKFNCLFDSLTKAIRRVFQSGSLQQWIDFENEWNRIQF